MTTYVARIYALETKYEFLKLVRIPAFAIPSITFPVMFYLLFGLAFGGGRALGGVAVATYLIATYGAFGVIGASLFGFGAGVAAERGQGWMLLKRATPMPPSAYFFAKLAVCLTFGAVIVLLLSTIGVAFGGVRLDAGHVGQARRDARARRDSILRARARDRVLRRAELGAAAREPHLPADGFRLRVVGSDRLPAAGDTVRIAVPAGVSPRTAGADRDRRRPWCADLVARDRPRGIYARLLGARFLGLPKG